MITYGEWSFDRKKIEFSKNDVDFIGVIERIEKDKYVWKAENIGTICTIHKGSIKKTEEECIEELETFTKEI
jgi:hypothetical protein